MARVPDTEKYGEEGALSALSPKWQAKDLVLDPWSGLAHKEIVGPGTRNPKTQQSLAASWVGRHARRLNAYRVLLAYMSNVSRAFLPTNRDAAEIAKHREYGDAEMLRDQIRAAVLGEEPEIVVEFADAEPEEPDEVAPVEEEVEAPGEQINPTVRAQPRTVGTEDDARTEFEQALARFERAQSLQEWFDEWSKKEKFPIKLVDVENDAVGLGDGVYYLAWSNEKRRVRLHCYDPGFYFPVRGDEDDYDFPSTVHLAWEEEDEDAPEKTWVRRITLRLVPISEVASIDGDSRRYPYQGADEEPSEFVCLLTDGRWDRDDLEDRTVETFNVEKAVIRENSDGEPLRDYDLGIDFIPIVHVPNTVTKHHYGASSLTKVAQLLDDIGQTDTDLATTADLAGAPPLAVKGARSVQALDTYGPGTVFYGDGVDVVDTSHALDALMKRLDSLLDRMSVNARIPKEVLGRVKMSEIASGITLLLAMGPFRAHVRDLRLPRGDKYPIMFTFVQRLAMVGANGGATRLGQTLTAGETQNVELRFGSFLPTDTNGLVEMILKLLAAHGISRASALKIMRDSGLDLDDDLAAELERIEHEDFEGASSIADALSSEAAAAEYLGRDVPPPPTTPGPGATGGGGGGATPGAVEGAPGVPSTGGPAGGAG